MKKLFTTLLIALIGVTSIKAQCAATFTYTVNPANDGTVAFSVTPTANFSYYWNFNNGTSGYGSNITYTFATGTWYVCLTASDTNGLLTCTFCDSITVINNTPPGCTASFSTYVDTLNGGGLVNIYNSSSGTGLHYFWQYGDGTQDSASAANFSHNYNAPGHYTICLTISNPSYGCSNTSCDSIYVQAPATCSGNFSFVNDSTGNGVSFISSVTGTADTYHWDFGDGTQASSANTHHVYGAAASYSVCLTVTSSTDLTCSSTTCQYVSPGQPANTPCSANFTVIHDTVNIYNYWVYNYSSGNGYLITSYLWDFGDGTSSTLPYPQHTYTVGSGPYNLCLTITSGDSMGVICTATHCDTIVPGHNTAQTTTLSVVNPATVGIIEQKEFTESLKNYPNPFSRSTTISYSLQQNSNIEVRLLDLLGNRVQLIESGNKTSGSHNIDFDASSIASGIYLLQLKTDSNTITRKLIITK